MPDAASLSGLKFVQYLAKYAPQRTAVMLALKRQMDASNSTQVQGKVSSRTNKALNSSS